MDLSEVLKNIDILRLFKEELLSTLSTSEMERRLSLSHHPTFRRLKMLEANNVIVKTGGGYVLNLKDDSVQEIMRFLSNIEKIEKDGKKSNR